MKLRELLEEKEPNFYVQESQWDEDGLMILVRNADAIDWPDEEFEKYYGINVVFSKKKGVYLSTADPVADKEAEKYRAQIIKVAKSKISKDDWRELVGIKLS